MNGPEHVYLFAYKRRMFDNADGLPQWMIFKRPWYLNKKSNIKWEVWSLGINYKENINFQDKHCGYLDVNKKPGSCETSIEVFLVKKRSCSFFLFLRGSPNHTIARVTSFPDTFVYIYKCHKRSLLRLGHTLDYLTISVIRRARKTRFF